MRQYLVEEQKRLWTNNQESWISVSASVTLGKSVHLSVQCPPMWKEVALKSLLKLPLALTDNTWAGCCRSMRWSQVSCRPQCHPLPPHLHPAHSLISNHGGHTKTMSNKRSHNYYECMQKGVEEDSSITWYRYLKTDTEYRLIFIKGKGEHVYGGRGACIETF